MAARSWKYTRGLHEIGEGCFAWLQPDGSWGWSNAGLVTDGEASLLVDTLLDLRLTAAMLAGMRAATRAAERIDAVVNTHANGDHCYGNSLVRGAEIIASRACAAEMGEVTPARMALLFERSGELGAAGEFFRRAFAAFDFSGIEVVLPTCTFEGELELRVGGKRVRLLEVGPAHTRGDVLVHSLDDRAVFTGDILFIEATPIMWQGPVGNWIRACERIEAMDVEVVVPGHGPLTDLSGARSVREYLSWLRDEARARFDAGLGVAEAVRDIDPGRYRSWRDAERIAVNVDTLYREFRGSREPANPLELFQLMASLR